MKNVLVMFALPIESRSFLRMLKDIRGVDGFSRTYAGELAGKTVCVTISGMGCQLAAARAQELISAQRPDALVLAGFAGALTDDLAPGDLFIPNAILDATTCPESDYPCDPDLLATAARVTTRVASGSRILTMDTIAHSPDGKAEVYRRYECGALDMESGAVARSAASLGIPFMVVRAVLDTSQECMPSQITDCSDAWGQTDVRALCVRACSQPRLIGQAVRLYSRSKLASRNLAVFLRNFIALDTKPA